MTRKYTNNRMQRETERFWTKIWQPRKCNEKDGWINNITKEFKGFEEDQKAGIHIDLVKTTLKHIETTGHDEIHGFWFKKFTSIRDRRAQK